MNTENQKCKGVVFSNRAYQAIKAETYDKDPVETGGILFGHILPTGAWVVVEVIPPGDNSTHQYAYFEYDEHFVNRVASQIADKYEMKITQLGLWHRHPGSMDFFSGTDDGTNRTFAELNPSYGAISGLVNIDPEFRMTMYHVDSPLNYTKVETFVGDDIIPAELLKLKEGVTFEDIDAIKKPKIRSEQSPAAPQQQTSQQTRQTTPNREEPRRTTPSRENHEKPQVVIQRPETGTDVFKKLILEHTTAFCFLVASVVVVLAGVFIFSNSQKTQVKQQEIAAKAEAERLAQETEARKAEEARKTEQAKAEQAKADAKKAAEEAKKAEEARKTEQAKAEQAKADAKKAEEARKTEQVKTEGEKAEQQSQQQKLQPLAQGSNESSENNDNDPAPKNPADTPVSTTSDHTHDNSNCAKFLEAEAYKKALEDYNDLKSGKKEKDIKIIKNHLQALDALLKDENLKNCKTEEQKIKSLRNNIDPQKLSKALETAMKKKKCDQKEAYTVLSHIKGNDKKRTDVHTDYKKVCIDNK